MKLAFDKSKLNSTKEHTISVMEELIYIDSLDDNIRAKRLKVWVDNYLSNTTFNFADLTQDELIKFQELFYKNIAFLKEYRELLKQEMKKNQNLKKFLS